MHVFEIAEHNIFVFQKFITHFILTILIGKAPGMPKIRKSCFTTTCLHTFGDRVGNYWMGEVSYMMFH